jgi:hypothetical protein
MLECVAMNEIILVYNSNIIWHHLCTKHVTLQNIFDLVQMVSKTTTTFYGQNDEARAM